MGPGTQPYDGTQILIVFIVLLFTLINSFCEHNSALILGGLWSVHTGELKQYNIVMIF